MELKAKLVDVVLERISIDAFRTWIMLNNSESDINNILYAYNIGYISRSSLIEKLRTFI